MLLPHFPAFDLDAARRFALTPGSSCGAFCLRA
jgi:hypothetical protein